MLASHGKRPRPNFSFSPFSFGLVLFGGSFVWGDGFSIAFLWLLASIGDGVKASFFLDFAVFSKQAISLFFLYMQISNCLQSIIYPGDS